MALGALGYLARLRGHYPQAADLTNESLALFRELGDKAGVSYSLIRLGNLAWRHGDYTEAMALIQESLNVQRDRNNQEGILALQSQALVACSRVDFAQATALLAENARVAQARALLNEIGDNLRIQALVAYANEHLTRRLPFYPKPGDVTTRKRNGRNRPELLWVGSVGAARKKLCLGDQPFSGESALVATARRPALYGCRPL